MKINQSLDADVSFREDYGTFSNMLKGMVIGDQKLLDADEYNRHSLHAIAASLGMKIITKKHRQWSAYWIMRVR